MPPGGRRRPPLPVDLLRHIFSFSALPDWQVLLASSGEDVLSWQVDGLGGGYNFTPIPALKGHTGTITGLAHDPLWGQGRLMTTSKDKTLRLWRPCFESEAVRFEAETVLAGHAGFVTHCLDAGNGRLGTAGKDGSVIVWNLTSVKDKTVTEVRALTASALREHVFRVNSNLSQAPFRRRIRNFSSIPMHGDTNACFLAATYLSDRDHFCFDVWNSCSGFRVLSIESRIPMFTINGSDFLRVHALSAGSFLTYYAGRDPGPGGLNLKFCDYTNTNQPEITVWRDLSAARDGSAFEPCNLLFSDPNGNDSTWNTDGFSELWGILPLGKMYQGSEESCFIRYRSNFSSFQTREFSFVTYAVPALQRGEPARPETTVNAYVQKHSISARAVQSSWYPSSAPAPAEFYNTLAVCQSSESSSHPGTRRSLLVGSSGEDSIEIMEFIFEKDGAGGAPRPVFHFLGQLPGSGIINCIHRAFGKLLVVGFKNEVVKVWWQGNAGVEADETFTGLQWGTELQRVETIALS